MYTYEQLIMKEIECMFRLEQNEQLISKLKILDDYVNYQTEEKISSENAITKIINNKSNSIYNNLKPSQIKNIIAAYNNPNNTAGYIQPIGKDNFLDRFLTIYPSPQMVHLSECTWSVNTLKNFIFNKYNCNICIDSIRKKLSALPDASEIWETYRKFIEKKVDIYLKHRKPIYIIQLYSNPFPVSKNNTKNYQSQELYSVVSFIYCYDEVGNKDIVYNRNPLFQKTYNPNKEYLNLEYLLQIPKYPGLVLLFDNTYTREILEKYNNNCLKTKRFPGKNIYLLTEWAYKKKWMRRIDALAGLLEPVFTDYAYPDIKNQSLRPTISKSLKRFKDDLLYMDYMSYSIEKQPFSSIPPFLNK